MSRKSSWWLRPQRNGTSNRAALNEANYFMEHNKALRERINELAFENSKLRELLRDMLMSPQEYCEKYGIEYEGWSSADDHIDDRMQELGIEVNA